MQVYTCECACTSCHYSHSYIREYTHTHMHTCTHTHTQSLTYMHRSSSGDDSDFLLGAVNISSSRITICGNVYIGEFLLLLSEHGFTCLCARVRVWIYVYIWACVITHAENSHTTEGPGALTFSWNSTLIVGSRTGACGKVRAWYEEMKAWMYEYVFNTGKRELMF